jgi:hypothetical protein
MLFTNVTVRSSCNRPNGIIKMLQDKNCVKIGAWMTLKEITIDDRNKITYSTCKKRKKIFFVVYLQIYSGLVLHRRTYNRDINKSCFFKFLLFT